MANFNLWVDTPGNRRYDRIYGSVLYSNDPNDPGNYNSSGQLVGTMRSISAPAYENWIGHPPTAQEMQAISIETAKAIYKARFWDEIKGDEINSQVIAEMAADMKSSAGGNGIKQLQKALNQIGYNTSVDGAVGAQTLQAINQAIKDGKTADLYENYRLLMLEYYQGLNPYYVAGWTRDMNKYYPQRDKNDPVFKSKTRSLGRDLAATMLIFLLIFGLVRYSGKNWFLWLLVFIPIIPPF